MRRGGVWVWVVLAVALAIPVMTLFGSAGLGHRRPAKPAAAPSARRPAKPSAPFLRPTAQTPLIKPLANPQLAARPIPDAGAGLRGGVPGVSSPGLRPAPAPLMAPPNAAFRERPAAVVVASGSPVARGVAMGAALPARGDVNRVAPPVSDTSLITRDPMLSPEDIEALKPKPKPKAVQRRAKPKVKRVDFAAELRRLVASVELQAIITKGASSKAIIDGDTVDVGSVIRIKKQALKIVKISGEGVVFSWKNRKALKAWKGGLE